MSRDPYVRQHIETGAGASTAGARKLVNELLVRGDVYFWGALMGACLIVSIPIAILYNFFVDRFVAGFTVGAIK